MNIAFPVLLLTLVLLPGFLFRYAMLRGTYRRSPVTAQQVAADLGWLTLFSAALHTLVGTLASQVGLAPRFDVVLSLLLGNFGKDSVLLTTVIQDLSSRPFVYLGYFAVVCALGAILGNLAHHSARYGFLAPFTSLNNDWHDLLDRETNAAEFDGVVIRPSIYLTAVVDMKHKDGPVLVRGLVIDWLLTAAGELDTVMLEETARRPLAADRPAGTDYHSDASLDSRYYSIEGDVFLLRRSEMITLNVQYLYTAKAADLENVPEAAMLEDELLA